MHPIGNNTLAQNLSASSSPLNLHRLKRTNYYGLYIPSLEKLQFVEISEASCTKPRYSNQSILLGVNFSCSPFETATFLHEIASKHDPQLKLTRSSDLVLFISNGVQVFSISQWAASDVYTVFYQITALEVDSSDSLALIVTSMNEIILLNIESAGRLSHFRSIPRPSHI